MVENIRIYRICRISEYTKQGIEAEVMKRTKLGPFSLPSAWPYNIMVIRLTDHSPFYVPYYAQFTHFYNRSHVSYKTSK